ncbi:hypothetical protein DKX38_026353 [Salix brachista]|uniref:Ubiquitin-like protease family profile domain-containing protein n=1 Tax=Salix brachista TaxID=2182728 RepID=A0A5N5JEE0_9ROSI|nr:hypothetical protein DKX38_026353 [Salix brachista]
MDLKLEERALIAFFESDHDLFCCAVLELVITEEKLDLDLEIEKVFQARSLALQVCSPKQFLFFNQILDNVVCIQLKLLSGFRRDQLIRKCEQTYQSRGFEVNPIRLRFFTEWEENTDDPRKCISFAEKHRIKENYMSDLLCCEKVFVPVFDEERNHFFLYVLQLKTQVVEIWDSFAASSQSDWGDRRLHNLLVSLDALFKDDIDQKYQNVWSFKDFRMERPSNVPQQPNGYDCGVYVIKFMVAPEEVINPDFVFDSDNERLEVALRLLASDVNSCSDDLASKAEAYCEQRFGNCENLS